MNTNIFIYLFILILIWGMGTVKQCFSSNISIQNPLNLNQTKGRQFNICRAGLWFYVHCTFHQCRLWLNLYFQS